MKRKLHKITEQILILGKNNRQTDDADFQQLLFPLGSSTP